MKYSAYVRSVAMGALIVTGMTVAPQTAWAKDKKEAKAGKETKASEPKPSPGFAKKFKPVQVEALAANTMMLDAETLSKQGKAAEADAKRKAGLAALAAVAPKLDALIPEATTPADKYILSDFGRAVGELTKRPDYELRYIDLALASGALPHERMGRTYLRKAIAHDDLGQFSESGNAMEAAYNHGDRTEDLEVYIINTYAEGKLYNKLTAFVRGIHKARAGTATPVPHKVYRNAIAHLSKAGLNSDALAVGGDAVAGVANKQSFMDFRNLYRKAFPLRDAATGLDLYRTLAVLDGLQTADAYSEYAYFAGESGLPQEALNVIDQGRKSGVVDGRDGNAVQELATVEKLQRAKLVPNEAAGMAAREKQAAAAATSGVAKGTGDTYYAQGNYAKAAEMYRLALTKTGGDANMLNLRLGTSLARAGDKAGANAALAKVSGTRTELARLIMSWLAKKP